WLAQSRAAEEPRMRERFLWFVPVIPLAVGLFGLRVVEAHRSLPGRQTPTEFGLPTFPGGFRFKSSTADPRSRSFAFLVKDRSADEVADYYRQRMKAAGYEIQEDSHATFPVPSDRPDGEPKPTPGRELVCIHRAQ